MPRGAREALLPATLLYCGVREKSIIYMSALKKYKFVVRNHRGHANFLGCGAFGRFAGTDFDEKQSLSQLR